MGAMSKITWPPAFVKLFLTLEGPGIAPFRAPKERYAAIARAKRALYRLSGLAPFRAPNNTHGVRYSAIPDTKKALWRCSGCAIAPSGSQKLSYRAFPGAL